MFVSVSVLLLIFFYELGGDWGPEKEFVEANLIGTKSMLDFGATVSILVTMQSNV